MRLGTFQGGRLLVLESVADLVDEYGHETLHLLLWVRVDLFFRVSRDSTYRPVACRSVFQATYNGMLSPGRSTRRPGVWSLPRLSSAFFRIFRPSLLVPLRDLMRPALS